MVIVDDDRGMRLIARMLAEEVGWTVVGEAETGGQALRLAARLAPECVLMDYRLPGMDGVEATGLVLQASPATLVIAWTNATDPEVSVAFRSAGASAFVAKDDLDALRGALRRAGARTRVQA